MPFPQQDSATKENEVWIFFLGALYGASREREELLDLMPDDLYPDEMRRLVVALKNQDKSAIEDWLGKHNIKLGDGLDFWQSIARNKREKHDALAIERTVDHLRLSRGAGMDEFIRVMAAQLAKLGGCPPIETSDESG